MSTLRQLGLIIIIIRLGEIEITLFHLIRHAFFKAILFIRAGIFIHGIIGVQDIRNLRVI